MGSSNWTSMQSLESGPTSGFEQTFPSTRRAETMICGPDQLLYFLAGKRSPDYALRAPNTFANMDQAGSGYSITEPDPETHDHYGIVVRLAVHSRWA